MAEETARAVWRYGVGILTLIGCLAAAQGVFAAQSVALAWNRSVDATVIGYRIYYGGASGVYTNTVDVGDVTNASISGLADGSTHYFAATAYDNLGLESVYSGEVSFSAPASTGTPPPPGDGPTVTITIRGSGTVTPDLNGQTLTQGKTYTITAVPGSGQEFAGWTGSLTSANPRLTFVAASNLVLQANFVASPFGLMAGAYGGLFYETDEVQIFSSGSFALRVSSRGAYSGALRLGKRKYSFSGKLNIQGQAANIITVKGAAGLSVSFQVGSGASAGQVFGLVTNASFAAALLGDRAVFNSRTNPAPYAGTYTLLIPGQAGAGSAAPAGYGFGAIRVTAAGKARLVGTLADGTKFSQSAALSQDGHWPFYAPLYGGGGEVLSWLQFNDQTNSDLAGQLSWIKLPSAKARYFPGGFTNDCAAVGSLYEMSLAQSILGLASARLEINGGNLASDITNTVALGPKSKVLNPKDDGFTLSFNLSTGTFRGLAADPVTGKWYRLSGAVLPRMNAGYGFLLGTNLTSAVVFEP
jgi:hypothetical protein